MTNKEPNNLRLFYDALQLIDNNKKQAYLTALERCKPASIQQEAPPEWFLARDAGDPWRAAQRYVDYWNGRVELFGSRAYYPLLGSWEVSESALSQEDIDCLETGQGQIAPPDKDGRTVFLLDHSLLEPSMVAAAGPRLRSYFYLLTKALQESTAEKKWQVVFAIQMVRPAKAPYDFATPHRFWCFPNWMPLDFVASHMLSSRPSLPWLAKAKLPLLGPVIGRANVSKVHLHFGASSNYMDDFFAAPILVSLEAWGITYKSLPPIVGGRFGLENFRSWLRKHRRLELHQYCTDEEIQERKRSLNNRNSRVKRKRRQKEVAELQIACERLRAAKAEADRENAILEQLASDAKQVLGMLGVQIPEADSSLTLSPSQTIVSMDAPWQPMPQSSPSHVHCLSSVSGQMLYAPPSSDRESTTPPPDPPPRVGNVLFLWVQDLLEFCSQKSQDEIDPNVAVLMNEAKKEIDPNVAELINESKKESANEQQAANHDALQRLVLSVATVGDEESENDLGRAPLLEPTPIEEVFAPRKTSRGFFGFGLR